MPNTVTPQQWAIIDRLWLRAYRSISSANLLFQNPSPAYDEVVALTWAGCRFAVMSIMERDGLDYQAPGSIERFFRRRMKNRLPTRLYDQYWKLHDAGRDAAKGHNQPATRSSAQASLRFADRFLATVQRLGW